MRQPIIAWGISQATQSDWSMARSINIIPGVSVLEYYLQTGDEPGGKFGELSALELNPDVDAVLFRILYDF